MQKRVFFPDRRGERSLVRYAIGGHCSLRGRSEPAGRHWLAGSGKVAANFGACPPAGLFGVRAVWDEREVTLKRTRLCEIEMMSKMQVVGRLDLEE